MSKAAEALSMRFLLFSIGLILVALVAVYYSDLTDEQLRHAIEVNSITLERQTKQARKQAGEKIEAVNERLKGLQEEYTRIRREFNKTSQSGKEKLAARAEKTEKATAELREKIAKLSKAARSRLQEQADYLQKQVQALKERVEQELDNQGAGDKSP